MPNDKTETGNHKPVLVRSGASSQKRATQATVRRLRKNGASGELIEVARQAIKQGKGSAANA